MLIEQEEVADLKARITKAKRQLLSLKAKLGEATAARDEALAEVASLKKDLQAWPPQLYTCDCSILNGSCHALGRKQLPSQIYIFRIIAPCGR